MPLARYILFICVLISLGCSTVPKETPSGKLVAVIKGPFSKSCTQLAKIKYDGTPFIHEEELTVILKEMTVQNKGNAVRFDTFTPGVTGESNAKGRATVFRCKKSKLTKYLKKAAEEEEVVSDDELSSDPEAVPKSEQPVSGEE